MNGVGVAPAGAVGERSGGPASESVARAREVMLACRFDENVAAVQRLLSVRELVAQRRAALVRAGTVDTQARVAALSEVAAASACTMHMAEVYQGIGELLDLRLPTVRDTALAGSVGYQQLAVVYHALTGVDPVVIEQLDREIAAAARNLAPGALGKEVERLLLAVDPGMADRLHARERTKRHVSRTRRRSGMADVKAYVTADEAAAVDGAIDAVAATVCGDDPRGVAARRADALVAMADGSGRLTCGCGREDCRAAASGEVDADRRVRVYVHADLATLAHLTDSPGYLEGYGPIAADYARMLAESGRWQVVFAEARSLAEHWLAARGGGRDQHGSPLDGPLGGSTGPQEGEATVLRGDDESGVHWPPDGPESGVGGEWECETRGLDDQDLDDPEWWEYIEEQMRLYENDQRRLHEELAAVRRRRLPVDAGPAVGLPRPAAPMPLRYGLVGPLAPVPVIGQGKLIDRIRASVASRPALADGVYPDGHGGYGSTPEGALQYRPSAKVRRTVRARDGHCRYPGCLVDAARCEMDHVVPFDHADPACGGWSVPENLHCLCKQHHQLKTCGMWQVAVLAGYAECWTSLVTGQRLIGLPDGFAPRSAPPPEQPPRRRSARRTVRSCVPDLPKPGEDYDGDPPPF